LSNIEIIFLEKNFVKLKGEKNDSGILLYKGINCRRGKAGKQSEPDGAY